MSPGSRYSASDARQASPSGITWPSGVVCESRTRWYSPATTAVRYVEMRGVAGKCHTAIAPPAPSLSPAGSGTGAGWFDNTIQCAGAVTWNVNDAFRSGCSKFA